MDNEIQLNKYYKLKYFYHIDPDRIISRLPKDSASKQDITSLFHAIFHEIILESKAFSEYILPENDLPNLSFFNDSYKNDSIRSKPKTLIALCKASLFHHCILHGFETHLSDSSSLKNPYIKKKMYYMNPILSLMNYSIFECTGKDPVTKSEYCGTYYFIAKGLQVSVGTIIKYKNINSHVVRLNEEN